MDSLDTVEIVVGLEENLNIDLPSEEAEGIKTLEEAIQTFVKHLKEKNNEKTD
jgi:acyl carrier protein